MQKKNSILKNNKGVTLIVLVVTIMLLVIISSVIIYNSTNSIKVKALNDMYNDVRLLNEQVFLYYSKAGNLPIVNVSYNFRKSESQIQDILLGYETSDFYVIDIDKMDKNIKSNLVYGKDYYDGDYTEENQNDVYIINIKTHQIFYAKGIRIENKTYYTIPVEENNNGTNQYTPISVNKTISNPPVLENGMKPYKYESSSLIETNFYDEGWYNYNEISSLSTWARAKDESNITYIWVPRLAYKEISENNYEIVFLKGNTNTPIDTTKVISGSEWKISSYFKDEENQNTSGIWIDITEPINSVQDLITRLNKTD